MEITSFTTTVSDFFTIANNERSKFDISKKYYVIPKYQREYKWSVEQVKTLISDINKHEKFLGNIILNEFSDFYEIVDGQQRITTLFLILIALFNKNKLPISSNRSEEQKELFKFINHKDSQQQEQIVIKNESIGDNYLNISTNNIDLNIIDDIYYQKTTFDTIFACIIEELESINNLQSFQNKVLDSQLLILIGDTRGRHNDSIEEVFLDINFKSKLLDVADIFKGYCFKNYSNSSHEELKTHWTKVRKYIKEFERIGYSDSDGQTCAYIYYYLLSKPDSYGIPANLSNNGIHYLENKNHSQTKELLVDMGNYGENVYSFYSKLYDTSYYFEDIYSEAYRYRNNVTELSILKKLLISIIENPNSQYYKFPLFMVIHYIKKNENLKNALTYEQFKKFVSNYYAYSFLFVSKPQHKSKSLIDKTIFTALYKLDAGESAESTTSGVLEATKLLRKEYLKEYSLSQTFDENKAYALFSLMDYYNAQDNSIKAIYEYPDFNKEHLIIHENTKANVDWVEDGNSFTFRLRELLGKNGSNYLTTQYKGRTANYIILPSEFNASLGVKDIVTKINLIKAHYNQPGASMLKHVKIFVDNIEKMSEYQNLVSIKGQKKSQAEITDAYKIFVEKYFDESSLSAFQVQLSNELKTTFTQ